jgi:hypothetical protein
MKRFLALALLFGFFASFAGCDAGSSTAAPEKDKPATEGEAK